MKRVLVIGATGTVGRQVVRQLAEKGIAVRALARNPEAIRFSPEVEVARGDLTQPQSLESSLDEVDAVFLVWIAPPTTIVPVMELIVKRARRIVFLSAPIKTPHPLFQQPNPLRGIAEQIESAIEGSGLEWTFLRPGMFAANSLNWWAPQTRRGDVVRWPYLSVPTAPIDENDIASVAVRTLCDEGHHRREYVLTGPESLMQREQIAAIGRATGRTLRIEEISPDEARQELLAIMPLVAINMLMDAWHAAQGEPALVTSTFADIVGHAPQRFADWAAAHAAEFLREFTAR